MERGVGEAQQGGEIYIYIYIYIYMYFWLIQVVIWQKPTQHCKACILQLKKEKLPTEKSPVFTVVFYQMFKEELIQASVMAQWLRVCLAMQGT